MKASYKRTDRVGVTLSIDASRCASDLLQDTRNNALVGGPYPHHFLQIPENEGQEGDKEAAVFIEESMKRFGREDSTEQLALEVKIAKIAFQWVNGNKPAYLQIAVCSQSKNKRSDVSQVIASGIVNAVEEL